MRDTHVDVGSRGPAADDEFGAGLCVPDDPLETITSYPPDSFLMPLGCPGLGDAARFDEDFLAQLLNWPDPDSTSAPATDDATTPGVTSFSSDASAGSASGSPAAVSRSGWAVTRPRQPRRRRRTQQWSLMLPPVAGIGAHAEGRAGAPCCSHCGARETPQWRAGPEGPGTLCNACGLQFKIKKGRLPPDYRPAARRSFGRRKNNPDRRKDDVVEFWLPKVTKRRRTEVVRVH